ncbi:MULTISPECIES: metal-sensing transcriptional repressor [Burkholderia cepacia complex]|uniref:Copper-sensing transcriptional repressor RicR n=1 Tax=Burkholderia cenocepacia TaxID=95486 RepID=A0A6J5JQ10_9BURK|nr:MULTISPECIES: metal-sensing transcriptional repressor [Burkholderia cepacia complex]RQT23667.1 nickel resistance protein [Burkholderia cepacia]CAB3973225.1 Copper-sensing transcriptional repressor RicR [Burkholderia cenocepacia]
MTIHASHPDIIKRLKRAAGHLNSVIAMLEEERPCVEIAQQLQAVESAVGNAKQALVRDHIDHCVDHAVREGGLTADAALVELKAITKYL